MADSNEKIGEQSLDDLLATMVTGANALYEYRDFTFPPPPENKHAIVKERSEMGLRHLDSIPQENIKSQHQRALFEYLRGMLLNAVPDYKAEAEQHLRKALELDPSLVDAWICLSSCLWKKGDKDGAKSCFTSALHEDPKNKKVLRGLSTLQGMMIPGSENPEEICNASIKYAREALALDVKDGECWLNLGNGYLYLFWVTGSWNHNMLSQSLKAFKNAGNDRLMNSNPFMWYNCSLVYMHLEDYLRALIGFEGAAFRNPPHPTALDQALKLCDVLDKVMDLIQIEAKRPSSLASSLPTVDSLTSSLATVNLNPSYQRVTVVVLSEGRNKGKVITGKVLSLIKCEMKIPLFYVLQDTNNTCFVITVYGIHKVAIKEGDQVTILDPNYQFVYFEWKTKIYHFHSVRVDSLPELLVNGEAVPRTHVKHKSMYTNQ